MRRRRLHRRGRKHRNKVIILSLVGLVFLLACGYGAFQTSISLNAKGNIKENDYPNENLILYLDAKNRGENENKWKDISSNNIDCTLNNFDNSSSSGWTDNSLIFDGINDWVDCGQRDATTEVTIIVAFKFISITENDVDTIVGNYEQGGFGITYGWGSDNLDTFGNLLEILIYIDEYRIAGMQAEVEKTYNVAGIYDGSKISFYNNGIIQSQNEITGSINQPSSSTIFALGGNPSGTTANVEFANIELYTVLIYDRALSETEITRIYSIAKEKYNFI